jgi:hypothetical protein
MLLHSAAHFAHAESGSAAPAEPVLTDLWRRIAAYADAIAEVGIVDRN